MPVQGRLLLLAICFELLVSPAWADKRVALVIGNGDYRTMQALKNPANDALDVADAFVQLGFDVTEERNLGRDAMQKAIAEFAEKSADADISVFYYAGHGVQLDTHNYMIPVDAELESIDDIPDRTIELQPIIQALSVGGGGRIVFLDACRNNPVPSLTLSNGLASPDLPRDNFLIAYSASRGQAAYDGGGRNSPFATAILQHLPEKGEDLAALLTEVRNDVKLGTGSLQLTQEWSTLGQQVYLAPGPREAFPPETMLFQLAAKGPDEDLLKYYLGQFPNGPHASDARSLIGSPASGGVAAANSSPGVEDLLWSLARTQRSGPLVELYLARYPDGRNAEAAKALLPSLATGKDVSPDMLCQRLATHPDDSTSTIPGVASADLHANRDPAIEACRKAVAEFPDNAHYMSLLARALAAGVEGAEIPAEAIQLYEQAAARGDARAMVSLGLLKQSGNGVPQDVGAAVQLYQQAFGLHFPDGGVQLGYALATGTGTAKDMQRAVSVYKQASLDGSARATYNLGVLYLEKNLGLGTDSEALDLFLRAADQGERSGYVAAGKILDGGYEVERDHEKAAQYLLMGISTDPGDAFEELTTKTDTWSLDTIRAVQRQLQDAGYYQGGIDGRSGPKFANALNQWRLLGPPSKS